MKILRLILIVFFLFSCKKEQNFMNDGVITGYDMRDCVCCGGLMINFNNETSSYIGEYYLIDNNPGEIGISDSSKFPIYISVDWIKDTLTCPQQHIKITKFKIK